VEKKIKEKIKKNIKKIMLSAHEWLLLSLSGYMKLKHDDGSYKGNFWSSNKI